MTAPCARCGKNCKVTDLQSIEKDDVWYSFCKSCFKCQGAHGSHCGNNPMWLVPKAGIFRMWCIHHLPDKYNDLGKNGDPADDEKGLEEMAQVGKLLFGQQMSAMQQFGANFFSDD